MSADVKGTVFALSVPASHIVRTGLAACLDLPNMSILSLMKNEVWLQRGFRLPAA